MKYKNYTKIEVPNNQSTYIGQIMVITEKSQGIIIGISYFNDFNSKDNKGLFRNVNYTRQLNNHLGYSLNKNDYVEMSVSNLKELMELNNFNNEEKNIVLNILQTYYISRLIGDAYLVFFNILQEKQMFEKIRQDLLNDESFKKEVLKDFLDSNLGVNGVKKKFNKI